ncbi:MAG TPA: carbon-nitrogen hydrolase family protein [Pseudolysinimonas sp.]|nr:carbon-nitrogen hydrolase family protein [Pseudolysinimonas sp.]
MVTAASEGAAGGTSAQSRGKQPANPVAIAVAQFAPGDDTDDNLERMSRLAGDAANRGALLVVFPEYSSYFTPTMDATWAEHAQGLHGPFVRALAELATELGIHVVAGLIERVHGETRVANTLVALDPKGELVAHYRKMHLYDAFGQRESEWIVPGPLEVPQTFPFAGFTVGLQTCYDLRFPEVTRQLVDAGADLVLVPSEWVRGPLKEAHWRTLVTARAIENTVYLAAADHAPPIGVGNSLIVDPMGVELAGLGEEVGTAVAWITSARVSEVRRINPALQLRRFRVEPR